MCVYVCVCVSVCVFVCVCVYVCLISSYGQLPDTCHTIPPIFTYEVCPQLKDPNNPNSFALHGVC